MVYFVTINYYSVSLILELIQSLQVATAQYKLIVVNNSPDDAAVAQLKSQNATIVLEAGQNVGFAAGCNLAIDYLYPLEPTALVWLINPDAVLQAGAVEYIQRCFAEDPSLTILGTQVQDAQGNLWFSRGSFNRWTGSLKHQEPLKTIFSELTAESRWVSGCSLIFQLSRFAQCPQFDPHYFLYYEDNDFCERYYQQGCRVAVTRSVLVTHAVSAISERNRQAKFTYATYSKLYFLKQHATGLALLLNLVYMLLQVIVRFPRDRSTAQGRWQGCKQFLSTWFTSQSSV